MENKISSATVECSYYLAIPCLVEEVGSIENFKIYRLICCSVDSTYDFMVQVLRHSNTRHCSGRNVKNEYCDQQLI